LKIAILGDSWGVPNYVGPPGVPPEYHSEFLLKNLGYEVTNFAINGGSNLQALNSFEQALKQGYVGDWAVWFYTDPGRDCQEIPKKQYYLKPFFESVVQKFWVKAHQIKKQYGLKLVVIGGQSFLPQSFHDYDVSDIFIEDMKLEVLGVSEPKHTFFSGRFVDEIDSFLDDTQEKIKIIDNIIVLYKLMQQSLTDFPDGCHPGIEPHAQLTAWLHEIFQGNNPGGFSYSR
jgi:hypothetical protein